MAVIRDAEQQAPFPLSNEDSRILALTDDQFRPTTWDEARTIIATSPNHEGFTRSPSQLREYIKWSAGAAAECGSVTDWLARHHLPKAWGQTLPLTPESSTPFASSADYRVMLNEWPYGWAPDLTHMVVWMRTPLPTEADTGTLTPSGRDMVEAFVRTHFVDRLGPGDDGENKILWWKNVIGRQSVRALEHFHVLVRNVDAELIEMWTKDEW